MAWYDDLEEENDSTLTLARPRAAAANFGSLGTPEPVEIPEPESAESVAAGFRERSAQRRAQSATAEEASSGFIRDIMKGGVRLTPERTLGEEFSVGLSRGGDQLEGLAYGFLGLAADGLGIERGADWGYDNYRRAMEEAATQAASVQDPFEDIEDLGDAGRYAVGLLGEQIPQLLTSILGGGVGGAVGKSLAKRMVINQIAKRRAAGEVADEAERKVAEEITQGLLTRSVGAKAAEGTARGLAGTVDDAARGVQGAVSSGTRYGAMTGAYLANLGQISGGTYGQIRDETGEGGSEAVTAALATSVPGAALDTLFEGFVASKIPGVNKMFGVESKPLNLKFPGRVAAGATKGAAIGSALEGTTEYLQTGLEQAAVGMADPNQTIEERLNAPGAGRERMIAAAAGATIGGMLGGGGGVLENIAPRTKAALDDLAVDPDETEEAPTAPQPPQEILGDWSDPIELDGRQFRYNAGLEAAFPASNGWAAIDPEAEFQGGVGMAVGLGGARVAPLDATTREGAALAEKIEYFKSQREEGDLGGVAVEGTEPLAPQTGSAAAISERSEDTDADGAYMGGDQGFVILGSDGVPFNFTEADARDTEAEIARLEEELTTQTLADEEAAQKKVAVEALRKRLAPFSASVPRDNRSWLRNVIGPVSKATFVSNLRQAREQQEAQRAEAAKNWQGSVLTDQTGEMAAAGTEVSILEAGTLRNAQLIGRRKNGNAVFQDADTKERFELKPSQFSRVGNRIVDEAPATLTEEFNQKLNAANTPAELSEVFGASVVPEDDPNAPIALPPTMTVTDGTGADRGLTYKVEYIFGSDAPSAPSGVVETQDGLGQQSVQETPETQAEREAIGKELNEVRQRLLLSDRGALTSKSDVAANDARVRPVKDQTGKVVEVVKQNLAGRLSVEERSALSAKAQELEQRLAALGDRPKQVSEAGDQRIQRQVAEGLAQGAAASGGPLWNRGRPVKARLTLMIDAPEAAPVRPVRKQIPRPTPMSPEQREAVYARYLEEERAKAYVPTFFTDERGVMQSAPRTPKQIDAVLADAPSLARQRVDDEVVALERQAREEYETQAAQADAEFKAANSQFNLDKANYERAKNRVKTEVARGMNRGDVVRATPELVEMFKNDPTARIENRLFRGVWQPVFTAVDWYGTDGKSAPYQISQGSKPAKTKGSRASEGQFAPDGMPVLAQDPLAFKISPIDQRKDEAWRESQRRIQEADRDRMGELDRQEAARKQELEAALREAMLAREGARTDFNALVDQNANAKAKREQLDKEIEETSAELDGLKTKADAVKREPKLLARRDKLRELLNQQAPSLQEREASVNRLRRLVRTPGKQGGLESDAARYDDQIKLQREEERLAKLKSTRDQYREELSQISKSLPSFRGRRGDAKSRLQLFTDEIRSLEQRLRSLNSTRLNLIDNPETQDKVRKSERSVAELQSQLDVLPFDFEEKRLEAQRKSKAYRPKRFNTELKGLGAFNKVYQSDLGRSIDSDETRLKSRRAEAESTREMQAAVKALPRPLQLLREQITIGGLDAVLPGLFRADTFTNEDTVYETVGAEQGLTGTEAEEVAATARQKAVNSATEAFLNAVRDNPRRPSSLPEADQIRLARQFVAALAEAQKTRMQKSAPQRLSREAIEAVRLDANSAGLRITEDDLADIDTARERIGAELRFLSGKDPAKAEQAAKKLNATLDRIEKESGYKNQRKERGKAAKSSALGTKDFTAVVKALADRPRPEGQTKEQQRAEDRFVNRLATIARDAYAQYDPFETAKKAADAARKQVVTARANKIRTESLQAKAGTGAGEADARLQTKSNEAPTRGRAYQNPEDEMRDLESDDAPDLESEDDGPDLGRVNFRLEGEELELVKALSPEDREILLDAFDYGPEQGRIWYQDEDGEGRRIPRKIDAAEKAVKEGGSVEDVVSTNPRLEEILSYLRSEISYNKLYAERENYIDAASYQPSPAAEKLLERRELLDWAKQGGAARSLARRTPSGVSGRGLSADGGGTSGESPRVSQSLGGQNVEPDAEGGLRSPAGPDADGPGGVSGRPADATQRPRARTRLLNRTVRRIARNAARTYVAGYSGLKADDLKGYTDDEIDRIASAIETDGKSSENTLAAGGNVIGQTMQPIADMLITQSSTDLLLGMGRTQKARSNTPRQVQLARKNMRDLIKANAFKDIDTFLKTVAADPKVNAKSRAAAQAFLKLNSRLNWNDNVSLQIAGFGRNYAARPITLEEVEKRLAVKDGNYVVTLDGKKRQIPIDETDPEQRQTLLDEVTRDIAKSNSVIWSGRASVDANGAYSVYLNSTGNHTNRAEGIIDTLLHELSHVAVSAKLSGEVELNPAERSAIARLETLRSKAILAEARSRGLDVPKNLSGADVQIITDQLAEAAAAESNQPLAALVSLEEFVVDVTHNPEVAKRLAELGFGKADGTSRNFMDAIKDVWNAVVTLITGVQVDRNSPLAEGFSDSWRLNFASVDGDAAPELIRSRMVDEMAALVAQQQFIEEQIEARDLAGTAEDRNRIAAEWPAERDVRAKAAAEARWLMVIPNPVPEPNQVKFPEFTRGQRRADQAAPAPAPAPAIEARPLAEVSSELASKRRDLQALNDVLGAFNYGSQPGMRSIENYGPRNELQRDIQKLEAELVVAEQVDAEQALAAEQAAAEQAEAEQAAAAAALAAEQAAAAEAAAKPEETDTNADTDPDPEPEPPKPKSKSKAKKEKATTPEPTPEPKPEPKPEAKATTKAKAEPKAKAAAKTAAPRTKAVATDAPSLDVAAAVATMTREEFVAAASPKRDEDGDVIEGAVKPATGGVMAAGVYWDYNNPAAEQTFFSLGGVFRDEVIPTGPGNYVREKSFTAVTRDMDRRGYQLLLDSQFNQKADASRADDLLRILGRQLREAANAGVRVNRATITTALGNLENPFTEDQLNDIARIRLTDPKAASEKRMVYLRLNRAAFRVKQQAALKSLPRAIKKTVREMNEHLMVLQEKVSDMVGGDMKLAVDENLGIYLNRSYSIFDLKDKWVQQIRKNTKVMADARRFIRRQLVKDNADSLIEEAAAKGQVLGRAEADRQAAKGLSAANVDNVLESFLAVYKSSPSLEVLSGRIPGQKNLSILTKRGVIAPEIQRLWGVNDDPETSYGKTVMKLTSLVHNHKFLTEFRELGLSEGWLRDNGEDRPVGYVKIATEGNERLSPLAGMYGNSEMVEGLYRMFPPRQKPNPVYNIAAKGTALSMAMATVGSAAGQVRNYLSGWLKLLSTGNFNLKAIGKGHSLAIQDVFKNYKDRAAARNAIEELIQLGIFGESVSVNLVENLLNDMQSVGRAASTKGPEGFLEHLTRPITATWDFAKGTYAMGDNIFKAIIYFSELENYRKAFPKMAEDDLKKKAAQIARDIHWTYSLAPEWVQELKKGPGLVIAPFITFTTEVVRTNVNTLKLAFDEIKSGNPELVKLGWRRVAGFTTALSVPSVVAGSFMAMAGLSSDDEEDLREFLPDWQKNNQLLLFGRKDGKISFADVSFADPNDYLKKPLWAFWRAVTGAEDITTGLGKAAAGAFQEALSPFASEQLLAGSLMDVARNTDSRGQRIYNPQDSTTNILKNVGIHVGNVFVPGTARSADRIYKAFTGQVTESGRAYDPFNEILAVVAGQRINEVDLSQSAGFAGSAYMREMRDASALFNRVFLSNGTQAPGAVAEALRLTNEARERIAKKYHRKYLSARSLGLSQTAFRDRLRAVGVGEDNTEAVMSGEIPPYVPSPDAVREAEKRGLTDRIREIQ